MAAWGTGLYQDDVAEDVKTDYYDCFREEGLDNEAAYQKMLSGYSEVMEDPEDGPVFWMVLSDIMWNLGKLTDEVKEKALYHIDAGTDIARWETESKDKAAKRRKVLEKLREKLESPMPKEKKLRKKRILKNKWQIGDMYTMPIKEQYPRFPGMKAKYLLLIKVGDRKDFYTGHIQPVVYIKYLEEEYHEGMDINGLAFSHAYDHGFRFIICGIAGRPKPTELTYVGNYGDLSGLKRPDGSGTDVYWQSAYYAKALESVCVKNYLIYLLEVDREAVGGDRIYMTEQEYQEEYKQRQEIKRERIAERRAERAAGKHYVCPWEDGTVYYLPIRKGAQGSDVLLQNGYVGFVMVKVGTTEEDEWATNLWPIMLICCVKKEYSNTEDIIRDGIFNQPILPYKSEMDHRRNEGIPEGLKEIGNIPDIFAHCDKFKNIVSTSWYDLERKMQYCIKG